MSKRSNVILAVLGVLAAGSVGTLAFVALAPAPQWTPKAAPKPEIAVADMYAMDAIGEPLRGRTAILSLAIADLDGDGLADVVAADAETDRIAWVRQRDKNVWNEQPIGEGVVAPWKIVVADMNADTKPDIVVACAGQRVRTDDFSGSVLLIENRGDGTFATRRLLEHVRAVTEIAVADVNADGRPDVVVAASGLARGEVRWLENLGQGEYRSHMIVDDIPPVLALAAWGHGADLRIGAVLAGERESLHVFRRLENGSFSDTPAWSAPERDWGSVALVPAQLGMPAVDELLLCNGGSLERDVDPRAHQGVWALRDADGKFVLRQLGAMAGCRAVAVADLDGDHRPDLVTVSTSADPRDPDAAWLTVWPARADGSFAPLALTRTPERLAAVAVGDLDGKGVPAIVTGAYQVAGQESGSRINVWRRVQAR